MNRYLPLLGLLLLTVVCAPVLGNSYSFISNRGGDFSSSNTALVMSWRSESEQFSRLNEQLDKDFFKWGLSKRMVKNIFYRTHKQLFLNYRQFSLAQDTFSTGDYDCVSGSLVLAGLLDYYGFDFIIRETSYHVFLEVKVGNDHFLMEVTDPTAGFISDKEEQKAYIEKYENGENVSSQWNYFTTSTAAEIPVIYRSISLKDLIGLQYFNQAIKNYNDKNELVAYQFSVTALKLYGAERIREFSDFLKQNILISASR